MRHFVLLTALVVAAGCSKAPTPPANQADYLPLAEGNEWYMDAAMVTSTGEVKKGTAHRIFEETVQQNGHTYLRSRTTIEFPPFGKQEYTKLVRKDEKGFYAIVEADTGSRVQPKGKSETGSPPTNEPQPSAPEQVEIPLPLAVGQHWERTDGTKHLRDTVIGVETVEIGGVVFPDCYHIHTEATNEKMAQDYWQAPKVGNIKSVSVLPNGTSITVILHEFKSARENTKH